ncbi:hypothetical protein LH51_11740 [Nitrincola sp. A-D6]|nr:hypothetical protein LH51_11740 [Nitrincola sp. A-D6]
MPQPSDLQAVNLQQDYLHAMGICRWLPREPLAHAPVSAEWVDGFVWPQPDLSSPRESAATKTAMPGVGPSDAASILSSTAPSVATPQHSADTVASRQHALAALQMDDVKVSATPAAKASVESAPPVEAPEVARRLCLSG